MSGKKNSFILAVLFSLTFIAGFLAIGFYPVSAQENTATASSSNTSNNSNTGEVIKEATPVEIVSSPDWDEEIKITEQSLIGQLEEYRDAYRAFLIAKEQLKNLETLKSIEDATQALKKVMEKRALVMDSHYKLLKLYLFKDAGIEPKIKDQLVQRVDNSLQKITRHQSQLAAVQNRAQAQVMADNYLLLSEELETNSYLSSAWLNFGKVQAVYWQAMDVYQNIDQILTSDLNKGREAEKERALQEIANLLDKVQKNLEEHKTDLVNLNNEETVTKQNYNRLINDLGPTYASLNKILSYYQELNELYGE